MPRYALYYMFSTINVAANIRLIYAHSFGEMLALASLCGCAYGGCCQLMNGVLVECFGAESVAIVYGYEYFGSAVETLFVLPVAARLSDNANSFNVAFVIAAVQFAFGALCVALCQWRTRTLRRRNVF